MISQYYLPENYPLPPTLACGLAAMGHDVRVVTGYPNYPVGKVFSGYRQRWRSRESIDSIEVLRVPLWADHSQSALRRSVCYTSFGLSVSTARRFADGADVIYVYATQMTPALGPWLWRMAGGAPYVLHIQDLWPDSITGSSIVDGRRLGLVMEELLTPWLSSVYRHAAAVIGIAPTMVATLRDRGVAKEKLHVVYNWAPEDAGACVPACENRAAVGSRTTNVLYAGNVGDMQDLETAIRAAHAASDGGIRLNIVGDGVASERMRALAGELDARNISFYGRVSRVDIARFYRQADYALVSLRDLSAFRGTVPSKFQAALSQGVPVITNVQGDVREIVEGHRVGYTADSESVSSLERAFRLAAASTTNEHNEMSRRASALYESEFAQASGLAAIEAILKDAASQTSRRKVKGRSLRAVS